MLTAIRNWVIKTMMKDQTGVVRTLPKPQIIELNTQMTAERIMRSGINPEDLKTVGQVENVVNQIDQPKVIPADSTKGKGITEQFLGKKKAPVFDMEGNKIDTSKGIMGGKEVKSFDELKNYTKSEEEIVQDLVDQKFGKGYFDNVDGSEAAIKEAAIKARLDASNKKGIETIKINLVDDSIAKIKSLEPIEAMKEANLVAGKKGRYANLDDNQVKKIMDDTQDHIFERDIPDEDFATGGRVGLKGGSGFLKFLKKFKVKQSGDDVKEFLSKRKFMKDLIGNTEKAKKARELRMLKEAAEKARAEGGFKFKDVDVDKDIRPIFDQSKDRTLNSDGGRIGLKGGGADFEMSNSEKEFEAYKNYLMNEGMIQGDKQLRDQMEKHKKKLMEKRYGIAVADGGRIGLKAGSVDKMRRLILKAMGAGTAGIAAAKSGIFSGLGKGATKQVAKEVAQQTTSSMPPPYFFKLAEKIKMMGDDATATTERTIAKTLKSKDGKSTYLLEEDITSGDTIIKKINKEGDEMITDVEIMQLKKGEVVQTKEGKAIKTPDEYEEVTESNSRIYKDEFNDPDYTDGIQVDEIIKEVDDKVPSIKYASGGLAYMLGE